MGRLARSPPMNMRWSTTETGSYSGAMFGQNSRLRKSVMVRPSRLPRPQAAQGRYMMMKLLVLAIAAAALGAPAFAQIDRSQSPVEIRSNTGEYLQKEGRGIYNGNVQATQGD